MKYAIRQLAKSPGFTIVVVLTLALCIGANSAIFSIVNAVLLRPFPYPESDKLVYVNNSYPKSGVLKSGVSIPDYIDRVERATAIESAILYTWESFNLSTSDRPIRALAVMATPSMFDTLQVTPAIGRSFDGSNAEIGNDQVVILSHALWQDNYGGRPEVVGESIQVNGIPHTVVGVMPAGFYFPSIEVKLWKPFAFTAEQRRAEQRGTEFSSMIARLKPGASPARLEQECAAIIQQNVERGELSESWIDASGFTALTSSIIDETTADTRSMIWLLQAGVVAVLLIGCANVANLLLGRTIARERELVIRSALGAGRWHLVRQLAMESILLFLAGGALGLLVANWGLAAGDALGVTSLPRGENVKLDRTVFMFTLASSLLTGIAFGFLPAWRGSRANAAEAIREFGKQSTPSRRQSRARHGLVIAEVALALMLLTTAGLLSRSFSKLQHQGLGFDQSSTLTVRLTLADSKYHDDDRKRAFAESALRQLGSLPGVDAIGITNMIPFGHSNSKGSYEIVGQESSEDQPPPIGMLRSVSPGYFAAMKMPLWKGRYFSDQDSAQGELVAIIDRALADRYWPDSDPIGQFIYRGERRPDNLRRIIGVTSTVKHSGLDDQTTQGTIYFPYSQRPVGSFTLVARTALPPSELISVMRQAMLDLDPELPLFNIQTMADLIESTLQPRRTPMLLIGAFSGMALLLSVLGVYGTIAFSVNQRLQEFGIRSALGATNRNVIGLILRRGLSLAAIGTALGLGGYLALSRYLQQFVYEIDPLDPASLLFGIATLFAAALLACWLPARRATKVDPMEALRSE